MQDNSSGRRRKKKKSRSTTSSSTSASAAKRDLGAAADDDNLNGGTPTPPRDSANYKLSPESKKEVKTDKQFAEIFPDHEKPESSSRREEDRQRSKTKRARTRTSSAKARNKASQDDSLALATGEYEPDENFAEIFPDHEEGNPSHVNGRRSKSTGTSRHDTKKGKERNNRAPRQDNLALASDTYNPPPRREFEQPSTLTNTAPQRPASHDMGISPGAVPIRGPRYDNTASHSFTNTVISNSAIPSGSAEAGISNNSAQQEGQTGALTVTARLVHDPTEELEDRLRNVEAQLPQAPITIPELASVVKPPSEDSELEKRRKRKRNITFIIIAFVILIGGGVGVGAAVSQVNRGSNNGDDISSTSSSNAPASIQPPIASTTQPTSAPITPAPTIIRLEAFRSILQPLSGLSLSNITSPQFAALNWIAYEDEAMFTAVATFELFERYALAVLYFSTSGGENSWTNQYNFLSGLSVCRWNFGLAIGALCGDNGFVEELILTKNNLQGTIPSELGTLRLLTNLDVSENILTGTLPALIGSLSMLEHLTVASNMLAGSIPPDISNLSQLTRLSLQSNSFSGSIPDLSTLSLLMDMELNINDLTGSIPESIASLSTLTAINLSQNSLNGTVPNLSGLSKLLSLQLGRNELTGSFPASITEMSTLRVLQLDSNEYTGAIPSVLNLFELTELDLGRNLLAGAVPSSIGRLTKLTFLSIQVNSLTGTVPEFVGSLPLLETLRLNFNDFTGDLAPFFCERSNPIVTLGADCFGPEIKCSCCTYCCSDSVGQCFVN